MNEFTNKIYSLHQVEMTSRCNLRCKYCTHPKMPRPKLDMTEAIYMESLKWAATFVRRGTQKELNVTGIGESTIHPDFVRFMFLAREAVGQDVRIVLTTNGIAVDEQMVRAIAPMNPSVFVSLHRPERAGPAIELFKKYRLLHGASADPSVAAVDWAGQVDWFVSAPRGRPCPWVRNGLVMVMADGRVSRCCFDSTGEGVIDTIMGDLDEMRTSAYSLCHSCDQVPYDGFVPNTAERSAPLMGQIKGIRVVSEVAA